MSAPFGAERRQSRSCLSASPCESSGTLVLPGGHESPQSGDGRPRALLTPWIDALTGDRPWLTAQIRSRVCVRQLRNSRSSISWLLSDRESGEHRSPSRSIPTWGSARSWPRGTPTATFRCCSGRRAARIEPWNWPSTTPTPIGSTPPTRIPSWEAERHSSWRLPRNTTGPSLPWPATGRRSSPPHDIGGATGVKSPVTALSGPNMAIRYD